MILKSIKAGLPRRRLLTKLRCTDLTQRRVSKMAQMKRSQKMIAKAENASTDTRLEHQTPKWVTKDKLNRSTTRSCS